MNHYVVIVQFLTSPQGRIFYMAYVFSLDVIYDQSVQTLQGSVTADSPEQALAEGEFLAWLLNLK